MRIAMWSGPRNLSTAMMYAFGNRADCTAVDEPFYAAYLAATGLDHPMREEILASQPNDISAAIKGLKSCTGIQYEKHMTHHMLPEFPRDWIADVTNVYLIRHPARVIASYHAKRENPTMDDLGFRQQCEIFEAFGGTVIDSADILRDPRMYLQILCEKLNISFEESMINWRAGPKLFDGVWALHWYGSVHHSTGFTVGESPLPALTGAHADLLEQAMLYYDKMAANKV